MIVRRLHRLRRNAAAVRLSRPASLVAVMIMAVPLAAGCGGDPSSAPLVADVQAKGGIDCLPAPYPDSGLPAWNSPVGFAFPMFFNQSHARLTIESVTLMSPHNLTVHGGLVYEMVHSQHALILANGWAEMGQGADPIAWARRQAIPGAIIPPGHPAPLSPPLRTTNRYEIVPEVTANSPAGGWALGEIVTYRADGQLYTVDAELGLAIGPGPAPASCNAEVHAIEAAWR